MKIVYDLDFNKKEHHNSLIIFFDKKGFNSFDKSIIDENPFSNNRLITLRELKSQILLNQKPKLSKLEKQIILNSILTSEEKSIFNLNSFFDVQEFSVNLFKFYKIYNEYKISDLNSLQKWQVESFQFIKDIKTRIVDYIEKIDRSIEEFIKIDNYDDSNLNYEKIYLVDPLYLSPLEKDIIEKISISHDLEIIIRNENIEFSKENLKAINYNLPEKIDTDINIIPIKNRDLEIINMINLLDNSFDVDIVDLDINNNEMQYLFNKEFINFTNKQSFKTGKIYKQLLILLNLISKYEDNRFNLLDLIGAMQNISFIKIHNLNNKILKKLYILADKGYRYIDLDLAKEKLDKDNYILLNDFNNKIKKLYRIKSLDNLINLLIDTEYLNLEILSEDRFIDEIKSFKNELFLLKKQINNNLFDYNIFSDNHSYNYLLLIINLLNSLELKSIKIDSKISISNFNRLTKQNNHLIITGLSEGVMPKKSKTEFLLNDEQKLINNLKSAKDIKLQDMIYFYNTIFSYEKVTIFSMENEDENIDRSSFVDLLINRYHLKTGEPLLDDNDLIKIIKKQFIGEKLPTSKEFHTLPIENSDFWENRLKLGSYDYNRLIKCPYQFYLNKIVKINYHEKNILYKLDLRILGIIVHNVFEEIGKLKYKEIIKGDFNIDNDLIKDIFYKEIYKLKNMIPNDYRVYYDKILFKQLIEGINRFFFLAEKIFKEQKIIHFMPEKYGEKLLFSENMIDFIITGKSDLIVETERFNYIFDYKTGNGEAKQLDFYSILNYGDADKANKIIYNAWDMEFIEDNPDRKDVLSLDDINTNIKEIIRSKQYKRADKKAACLNCEYKDICRLEWQDESE